MRNTRWIVALVIAIAAVATYFGSSSTNPITGETQRVATTPEQEIALGLKSAPEMGPSTPSRCPAGRSSSPSEREKGSEQISWNSHRPAAMVEICSDPISLNCSD
jgi:hypothetical protein